MTTKKYNEPGIQSFGNPLRPFSFPPIKSVKCRIDQEMPKRDFLEVVNNRKSGRSFSQLALDDLGGLFFHSCRTRDMVIDTAGSVLEKRNYASPGALYSVHCLVTELAGDDWFIYTPLAHCFDQIDIATPKIQEFKAIGSRLLPETRHAWLIWYVCDYDLVCSRYKHPDTLVFREAGHLSATHSLVAEYLGLAYCPLGYHGHEEAMDLSPVRKFVGVGSALVAGRP